MKTNRDHLNEHDAVVKDMELADACVSLLERMSGSVPQQCIKKLKHYSMQKLKPLDRTAEALGAPYPGLSKK